MCANDVITCGAEPLFFLDYIATGKLSPAAMAEVVEGIASGCSQSGCSLLGAKQLKCLAFIQPVATTWLASVWPLSMSHG